MRLSFAKIDYVYPFSSLRGVGPSGPEAGKRITYPVHPRMSKRSGDPVKAFATGSKRSGDPVKAFATGSKRSGDPVKAFATGP